MSDKKQKNPTHKQQEHQPVLLEESYVHHKSKPPYILIGILIFIIITGFWKVHMAEKSRAEKAETPQSSTPVTQKTQ